MTRFVPCNQDERIADERSHSLALDCSLRLFFMAEWFAVPLVSIVDCRLLCVCSDFCVTILHWQMKWMVCKSMCGAFINSNHLPFFIAHIYTEWIFPFAVAIFVNDFPFHFRGCWFLIRFHFACTYSLGHNRLIHSPSWYSSNYLLTDGWPCKFSPP